MVEFHDAAWNPTTSILMAFKKWVMDSRSMSLLLLRNLWSLTVSLLTKCVWQVRPDQREWKDLVVNEDQKELLESRARKVFKIISRDLSLDAFF